ncbi:hypothetical protein MSC49_05660 [Methylosinus sp. C49]|uniref:hypothetical protein n=1 Tax=Methylosinus sp. C49 TaxID=2699395 RepID=UPI001366DE26|nr:hypothetical protein [Methylosinus sp. C49]BBU60631.1 hypothetical protein MSC49_05660 [Methylosinus sp. C49]
MKKPLLFAFFVAAALAGASARSMALEASLLDWLPFLHEDSAEKKEARRGSAQALCKEVEVPIDEGYGVSRHERRVVCEHE